MAFSLKTIFTTVFGNKKDLKINSQKLINLFTPVFSDSVDPRLNDTFMSAVNTHAMHISKIKPTVFLNDKPDKSYMTRILSIKPNPIMEAGAFWEKVARNYYIDNNVFIYIDWDLMKPKTPLRSLWIIDPDDIAVRYDEKTKGFYFQFNLMGESIVTSMENILHIARHVDTSEIFGGKTTAIENVLKIINTNYEGIETAIKTSAFLRFVINTTVLMNDSDRKKKAEEFADTYLSKDGTGIAYLDASSSLTQVNSQAKYANADEMKIFETKILNYLNISEKVIQGNMNQDEWQAYYEASLESFINKLTNELNIKLFTERELDVGNKVRIPSSDMQIVSFNSRVSLLQNSKEIGLLTINEYRKLFNLGPVEDGEVRLVSLNYISSLSADEYQLNKSKSFTGQNQNNEGENDNGQNTIK